ncbi:MAG: TonB-dependent receptor [Caulobacteraceae bacterium]|nr:TonB-dependent receptor [Caulobacteraceae bacterium]
MFKSKFASLFYGCALGALALSPAAHAATATDAAATAATPGGATTSLSEVVVQARRTSENLQKVPVAVTVVSQKEIDSVGVFNPQNLANMTPGLTVPAVVSDVNDVIFSIRGQSYSYSNNFNAVFAYYDDTPITSPSGVQHGIFFDLDSVQVLRGPQGTQFGRVTDGGNVMIYPKKPSNSFDGFVEGKVGDYGLREFTAALNIPLIPDKLLLRAAVDIDHRDGYVTNIYNGKDLNDTNYQAYRFGIVIRPMEHLENYTSIQYFHSNENGTAVQLNYIHQPLLQGLVGATFGALGPFLPAYGIDANGNVVPAAQGVMPLTADNYINTINNQLARQQALGPFQVYDATPLFDRRDNIFVVNTTTADLPFMTIKNIFGYQWSRDFEAQNFAGGNGWFIDPCHSGCPLPGQQNIPFGLWEQFSEEFHVQGKLFDDRLSWSAGAYSDAQKPAGAQENAVMEFAILQRINIYNIKTWETAGYGNAEFDLRDFLPGLKINGGIRYTVDSNHSQVTTLSGFIPAPGIPTAFTNLPAGVCVSFSQPCLDLHSKFSALTYTAGATYQISPNQMVYAKVSRGYRPGGVNQSAPPNINPQYNPEFDLSVEIGAKADFDFNGVKLRTNLALFHDDYTNIQQNVILPVALAGGNSVSVVRNVDDAVIQGVEFEGTLIPVQGLVLDLNYAYTDAAFKHLPTDNPFTTPDSPCVAFTLGVGWCGENAFGFTPRNKISLSADYDLPLDPAIGVISVGGTWSYQSKMWQGQNSVETPHALQPAFNTLDLRATWHGMFGQPVDASFFMTNVTNTVYLAGSDDLEHEVGTDANIYAAPRMFGFGLKYRFGASAGS